MKVKLKCQWDNGELVLPPGTETEINRDQAFALADMGMVEVLIDKEPPKPVKPSTATKAATVKAKGTKKAKAAENISAAADNDNQDSDNGSPASDDGIPDPDSLVDNP